MKLDVPKARYPFCTAKKMSHVMETITEMPFVDSSSQVYYDNLQLYTKGHLQIFKPVRVFFSRKHCHGLQRNHNV